ncbi:tetratricopeptide repeat protein [Streptomyces sp. NBC_01136]|uniref:tetratricopeptide repeat protein n=1 Tax=unclassified Streptomyces TaxID=2593676 RepID=UPI003254AA7A|nr:tetratricopeptide repeat protein [Streptomyces sp. NBC_01136]
MLQLAAMLDPNGIPDAVLTSPPALNYLTQHRSRAGAGQDRAQEQEVTTEDAVGALEALHSLSLIDDAPSSPHRAIRVHQLVQRTARDTLTLDRHDQLAHTAADALTTAWPGIERDPALAQTLRANTAVLTAHAEDALHQPDIHWVLYRTGRSLGEGGQATAATAHFHRLTETATRYLGPDHLNTLAARGHLVCWRGEAGDAAGAVDAFEELVTDLARVLGKDHPHTLIARGNLIKRRGSAGDPSSVVAELEELATDLVRVLGEDHPNTLITRTNLACWRGEAGDAAGAVAGLEELVTDAVEVLGEDHPHTLDTRRDLAHLRGMAGDAAGAVAGLEELVTDLVRVLGLFHPYTLDVRGHLAGWRREAGMGVHESTD